jgi:predicted HAD superfamily Cof-like phosphohydrolase
VTAELFQNEIKAALKAFDHYIVCLDKTTEDFHRSLESLMQKAIKAYENRGEGMRHGIALDNQVTIILSQTETEVPLCGIYFNLHSPYKKATSKKAKKES